MPVIQLGIIFPQTFPVFSYFLQRLNGLSESFISCVNKSFVVKLRVLFASIDNIFQPLAPPPRGGGKSASPRGAEILLPFPYGWKIKKKNMGNQGTSFCENLFFGGKFCMSEIEKHKSGKVCQSSQKFVPCFFQKFNSFSKTCPPLYHSKFLREKPCT